MPSELGVAESPGVNSSDLFDVLEDIVLIRRPTPHVQRYACVFKQTRYFIIGELIEVINHVPSGAVNELRIVVRFAQDHLVRNPCFLRSFHQQIVSELTGNEPTSAVVNIESSLHDDVGHLRHITTLDDGTDSQLLHPGICGQGRVDA